MKKLIIKAISDLGLKAIAIHKESYKKIKGRDKIFVKLIGMTHRIISDSQIELEFSNRYLETDGFIKMSKDQIIEAFKESEAQLNLDYTIEEVKL